MKKRLLTAIAITLLLTSCAQPVAAPTPTAVPPTPTAASPTPPPITGVNKLDAELAAQFEAELEVE